MTARRLFLLLLLVGLTFPVCKRAAFPEKPIFRFIDNLDEKNVAESPLMKITGETEEPGKFYPVKSYPVTDMGSGSNPYGIKRKLNIRNADSNVLFAPPKSLYVFDVDIPADGVLEFGTGIVKDKNSEKILESPGQEEITGAFSVLIEIDGQKKTLFEKTHRFPNKDQRMVFQTHKIDLSFHQGKARFYFATDAPHPNFSFWYNPILFQSGSGENHIILISLDTLRSDHLGCYGYSRDTSPSIDALSEDSALFLNTYSSSPWTLPSHVSLLTSLNGMRHMVHYED